MKAKWGAAPFVAATGGIWAAPAFAQSVDLNYDRLSSLEEPIAVDLGQVTVELTGVMDVPIEFDLDGDPMVDNVDPGFIGNFQISAQTQLPNRWRLGAAYFGQYATDASQLYDNRDDYHDNVAGFIGTSFGTVLGGNVNGQVREVTRRRRGVGNGFLSFDDFYGKLDNWGGAYVGRYGPTVVSAAVDENGDFELGGFFQRPLGQRDYRFALRFANARLTSHDGTTQFDTKGAMAVGEIVYGSTVFDIGAGYEKLESDTVDVDRWFLSTGMQTQIGPWRLSGEAHYGKAAGNKERSVGLGASYDFARGLSVNAGVNYEKARIEAGPVKIVQADAVRGLISLRFSF